ncbi:MAG: type VI secretion system baseplate subunit TssG [bacterium]
MGTERGPDFARLIAELERHAPEYQVFQAIYLAEIASRQLHPQRQTFGLDQVGLKFRPHEMYVYPPKDIRTFECRDSVMTFVLNFMGLYGVNAPLPRCYHEQVALQQSVHGAGNVPLQNFLDIFNNRFYWLYYQAWKKYRYYLQLSEEPGNKTTQRVFAFIGQGIVARRESSGIARMRLLQFSGILSQRVRNKAGLHILLREFFPKYRLAIQEFVPHWVQLAETPRMGGKGGEPAFQLGVNSVIGRTMLDYMGRICLEIGPMPFVDYLEFTPAGRQAVLLKELLRLYLNDGLEFDVKFIIQSESIVTVPWNDKRLRLGSTIWLGRPKEELVPVYYAHEQYVGRLS